MATIVAFGELLWDLLPEGPVLGGAPFNFAYRAGALGHRAFVIGRIGRDELGRRALERIEELDVDGSFLQRDPEKPTGTVEVRFDPQGGHDFTIIPNTAYDFIEPAPEALELAARADCLCFGTLAQREKVSRETLGLLLERFRGRFRLLDVNLRRDCYTEEVIRASLQQAEILKLNDGEVAEVAAAAGARAEELPGAVEALLRRTSLRHVVLTLGAGGAFAASRGGQRAYVAGYAVEVVDTVGSGDAFTAGFIDAMLRGAPLAEACRRGNALGALVAAQEGATQVLDAARLEELLEGRPPGQVDDRFREFLTPPGGVRG